MRPVSNVSVGIAVAALAIVSPGCSHQRAAAGSTAMVRMGAGGPVKAPRPGSAPARFIPVDQRAERTLTNGCVYSERVQGTLREIPRTGSAAEVEPVRYAPSLSVEARLACPGVVSVHRATNALEGVQLGRGPLERAIENLAAVPVPEAAGVCTVRPRFALHADALVLDGVARACTPAVGGGPRVDSPAPRGPSRDYEITVQSPLYPATRRPGP
jgi:hypothetical protein